MQTWSIQGNTCGLPTFCGETGNNRNTAGKCSQYRELGEQVRLGFMELEGMVQRMLLFSCSVVSQLLSNPWTAACQASLTSTISQRLLRYMSFELVMLSIHLILWHPFSFCLRSFPASGSFPVSWLFASGGQSIGASASASVLPMNIQG